MRLLGGEIQIESEPGRGSTLRCAILPVTYDPSLCAVARRGPLTGPVSPSPQLGSRLPPTPPKSSAATAPRPLRHGSVEDDREKLTARPSRHSGRGRRRLVRANSLRLDPRASVPVPHRDDGGRRACAIAAQYRPARRPARCRTSRPVGPVGPRPAQARRPYPSTSPSTLCRRTTTPRHAPSLRRASATYCKPVKREELARALQRLETRLEQRLRRVLIVEDDAVQLDSLRKLARRDDVETVGAATCERMPGAAAGRNLRLHGTRPVAARRLRLLAAGNAQPRRRATRSRR